MPSKPLRILVLADTHNHLPPNIAEMAKGVDEIWHLGDFCAASVLEQFEELGPTVTLVRGNCDSNSDTPLVVDLVRNGVRLRLVHIPPAHGPENIDVLLHGHTHVPRTSGAVMCFLKSRLCYASQSRRASERGLSRHPTGRRNRLAIIRIALRKRRLSEVIS